MPRGVAVAVAVNDHVNDYVNDDDVDVDVDVVVDVDGVVDGDGDGDGDESPTSTLRAPSPPAIHPPVAMPSPSVVLAILASGIFFLTGLLTGVWKYAAIARSESAAAPVYVDVAHRASLLYAFASQLLAWFAGMSAWSDPVNFWAVLFPVVFFAGAIGTYVVHGALRDTDNQLARPHRLGRGTIPGIVVHGFMVALIVAEIGGFVVLFAGVLRGLRLV